MKKRTVISELLTAANELDSLGLRLDADIVDRVANRIASEDIDWDAANDSMGDALIELESDGLYDPNMGKGLLRTI